MVSVLGALLCPAGARLSPASARLVYFNLLPLIALLLRCASMRQAQQEWITASDVSAILVSSDHSAGIDLPFATCVAIIRLTACAEASDGADDETR